MLDVHLFGPFEATFDGTPLPRPQRTRTGALWVCLLLHSGTPLARDRAAFMIWPDLSERDAKAELRRHVHWLGRYLERFTGTAQWIEKEQGRVRWSERGRFTSDVGRFEERYRRILEALRDRRSIERAGLVEAIELQEEPLLPDLWDEWIGRFRRTYHSQLEHLLELLLSHDESIGDLAGALATGRRLLELDRFREESHRAVMRLHVAAGDRAAATHQFQVCRSLLRDHLDVDPMPETIALYRTIRAGGGGSESGSRSAAGVQIAERGMDPGRGRPRPDAGGIPRPPTGLVGRQEELGRLAKALERTRLLTLVGPGGVGKSRIAAELCERELAASDVPIRWTDLTTLPHGAPALPAIAAAVGLAPVRSADADADTEAGDLERLCEHLDDKPLLLVLDGAEHVLRAIGPGVSGLLARCPGLRILATSREPIGVQGEVVRRIRPLRIDADDGGGPGEAVALFVERARDTATEIALGPAQLKVIADICRSLDGLPLAIELAAARTDSRSLEDIRSELSGLGSAAELRPEREHGAPPNRRGIKGAFDWSYRLLSEQERLTIRAVSVFAGSFDARDVDAILPHPGSRDVIGVLRRLVATSVIEVVPGPESRYRMLAPLRSAAWLHAVREGESDALVTAALEHVVYRAERITDALERIRLGMPDPIADPLAMRRLYLADHRWAMSTLDPEPPIELSLRLAAASWRVWSLEGAEEPERRFVERVLRRAESAETGGEGADYAPLIADAHFAAGVVAYQHADPEAALRHYDAALEAYRADGEPQAIWMTLDHLALVHGALGDPTQALQRCDESLRLKRDAPDAERADTIAIRAHLHMRAGDVEAATEDYERALATLRHAPGRRRSLLNVLRGLGIIALGGGRPRDAASYFAEGLEISRSWDDRAGCAVWLNELGCLDMDRGELDAATVHFKEALEIHRDLGATQRAAILLNNLGELAIQQDDNVLARYYFTHSLRLARHKPDDPQRINTLTNLAEAHAYLGEVLRARQTADEALELALAVEIPSLVHHARSAQGLAALMAGEFHDAALHFGESAAGWHESGDEGRAGSALELGAIAIAEHGEEGEARAVLSAAKVGPASTAPLAWASLRSPFARRSVERIVRSERGSASKEGDPLSPPEAAQRLIAWARRGDVPR